MFQKRRYTKKSEMMWYYSHSYANRPEFQGRTLGTICIFVTRIMGGPFIFRESIQISPASGDVPPEYVRTRQIAAKITRRA